MKTFRLILVAVLGVFGLAHFAQWQHKEQVIREHRFHLAMPSEEVFRSLGKPLLITTTDYGKETWTYPTVEIIFGHGRVIDSQSITPVAAAAPAKPGDWMWKKEPVRKPSSRSPQNPERVWSQLPDGRWKEHDSDVSAMHSIGGGG